MGDKIKANFPNKGIDMDVYHMCMTCEDAGQGG